MPRSGFADVADSVVDGLGAGNPRPTSAGDVISILEAAYEGAKPPVPREPDELSTAQPCKE